MSPPRRVLHVRPYTALLAIAALSAMASCVPDAIDSGDPGPFAPGVDLAADGADDLETANRLLAAGESEMAIDAFIRAALDQGMSADILTGLGSANLKLGRLHQAETLLRQAVEMDPNWPEAWNNLGVVLMEKEEYPEAAQVFRKAYALDSGGNDQIRDNLRLALVKIENIDITEEQAKEEYKIIQDGDGSFRLVKATEPDAEED